MSQIVESVIDFGSAYMSAEAQKDAARTASESSEKSTAMSIAAMLSMYEQSRKDNMPYQQAGLTGLGNILGKQWSYTDPEQRAQIRAGQTPISTNALNGTRQSQGLPVRGSTSQGTIGETFRTPEGQVMYTMKDPNNEGMTVNVPLNVQGLTEDQINTLNNIDLRGSDAGGTPIDPSKQVGAYQQNNALSTGNANLITPGYWEGQWGGDGEPTDYWKDPSQTVKDYQGLDTGINLSADDVARSNFGDFNFQFNETDPVIQKIRNEASKKVNQGLMARGQYDSRAGVNALAEADVGILQGDLDRQFNRYSTQYGAGRQKQLDTYGQNIDWYNRKLGLNELAFNRNQGKNINLYNMQNALANQRYGKDIDLTKIGQGSAAQAGQNAISAASGIGNAYQNNSLAQQNAAYNRGNAQGAFYSGMGNWGGNTVNALSQYYNQPDYSIQDYGEGYGWSGGWM